MAIETVLEAVRERLFSVLGDLGEEKPTFTVGEDRKDEQDSPPRIVWVLRGGPCGPRVAAGGDSTYNPSALFQRRVRCDAHIWCTDFTEAERLMNHLVAAIHAVMPGSWVPLSENWDIGQAGKNSDGRLVILAVELRIPFTRELDATAVLEGIPITPEVDPLVAP